MLVGPTGILNHGIIGYSLINHIVLLILYIYCGCNLCVSLYLFLCLMLFFQFENDLYIFSSVILTLIKIVLLQSELLVYRPLGQRLVLRGIWPTFFRCPHLLGSLFSEFTMEAKPYRSGLMAKVAAGKMPLRMFNLWGVAFPGGIGHSPLGVCLLDQSGAHPSLAPTSLSVHLPFSLFLMGFLASSFTGPYRNPSLSDTLGFQDLFCCSWHWRESRNAATDDDSSH